MPTIQNEKYPKSVSKEALLRTERSRWFVISLIMGCISIASVWSSCEANQRAHQEIKLVWVKLSPSGTWDIDFYDESRGVEFFPATIDYIIRNFVIRRYSKIPHSIKSDYGYVYKFMSQSLQSDFKTEFGAVEKADKIASSKNSPETHIRVRTIDHYDSDKTSFKNLPGTVYRTNVFIDKTTKHYGKTIQSEKCIIPLTWRIKSRAEILSSSKTSKENPLGILKYNPIGLEILSYEQLIDHSK